MPTRDEHTKQKQKTKKPLNIQSFREDLFSNILIISKEIYQLSLRNEIELT